MSPGVVPTGTASTGDAKARVMTMIREYCPAGSCLIEPLLARYVGDAALPRWDGKAKNVVLLPAFREVREGIHVGRCPEWTNA